VLKQVRTLEPGPRALTPEAAAWPLPRELFVRLRRVTTQTCRAALGEGSVTVSTLRALTDASLPPDVGFAAAPFEGSLTVTTRGATLAGWPDGAVRTAEHPGFTVATTAAGRGFVFDADTAARMGLEAVTVAADAVIVRRDGADTALPATCADEVVFATPRDYLLGLLPSP
jgi:hypothetical protein